MSEELKPCPFCGAMLVKGQSNREDFYYPIYTHPDENFCILRKRSFQMDKYDIEKWNRRVKDKELLDLAISLVQDELVTVGKGADIAGLPYHEFEDELRKRGVRYKE